MNTQMQTIVGLLDPYCKTQMQTIIALLLDPYCRGRNEQQMQTIIA